MIIDVYRKKGFPRRSFRQDGQRTLHADPVHVTDYNSHLAENQEEWVVLEDKETKLRRDDRHCQTTFLPET